MYKSIENKITTDHDHDKYITTQGFNNLTSENFTARLKQTYLASNTDIILICIGIILISYWYYIILYWYYFATFVKKTNFDNKLKNVTSNKMN